MRPQTPHPRSSKTGSPSLPILLVLLAASLLLAGCASEEDVAGGQTEAGEVARTGSAEPADGATDREAASEGTEPGDAARAEGAATDADAGGGGAEAARETDAEDGEVGSGAAEREGRLVLRLEGDPGTRFSGECVVEGETEEFSGRVPERFVYRPENREIACEVAKVGSDTGTLRASFTDGEGTRSVQEIGAPGGTVRFEYQMDGGVSISSSSGTVSSQSSSSSVSGSS